MIQTAFAVGRSVAPLPRRGTDTASAPPPCKHGERVVRALRGCADIPDRCRRLLHRSLSSAPGLGTCRQGLLYGQLDSRTT